MSNQFKPTSFLKLLRVEEAISLLFLLPGIVAPFILYAQARPGSEMRMALANNMIDASLILCFTIAIFWAFKRFPNRTQLLRDFAPFLFVIAIYLRFGDFILLVNPHDIHMNLMAWDHQLFGLQPGVWIEKLYHPRLTDWSSIAYIHYYLVTFALLVILYSRQRFQAFRQIMVAMMVCYFLGFLGYLSFPSPSPYLLLADRYSVDIWEHTWFPSDLVRAIVSLSPERARDTFPSLHNGITLLTLLMAWRYERLFFWVQLPLALSLSFATVYLRYHFVVDVFAGFLVGISALYLTPVLMAWWPRIQGRSEEELKSTPLKGT